MAEELTCAQVMEDPERGLEQSLIEEFLRVRGLDSRSLRVLRAEDARRLLAAASVNAGAKLAEVEARAHFVHEIHSAAKTPEDAGGRPGRQRLGSDLQERYTPAIRQ